MAETWLSDHVPRHHAAVPQRRSRHPPRGREPPARSLPRPLSLHWAAAAAGAGRRGFSKGTLAAAEHQGTRGRPGDGRVSPIPLVLLAGPPPGRSRSRSLPPRWTSLRRGVGAPCAGVHSHCPHPEAWTLLWGGRGVSTHQRPRGTPRTAQWGVSAPDLQRHPAAVCDNFLASPLGTGPAATARR